MVDKASLIIESPDNPTEIRRTYELDRHVGSIAEEAYEEFGYSKTFRPTLALDRDPQSGVISPEQTLREAGFEPRDPTRVHLCDLSQSDDTELESGKDGGSLTLTDT